MGLCQRGALDSFVLGPKDAVQNPFENSSKPADKRNNYPSYDWMSLYQCYEVANRHQKIPYSIPLS